MKPKSNHPLAGLALLNAEQRRAVEHGVKALSDGDNDTGSRSNLIAGPLLVIAGAGAGKTGVIAHRVAHLLANGADPARIMLLTFTNHAAREMINRVKLIVGQNAKGEQAAIIVPWAGTFHSIGLRFLRIYAKRVGLKPGFGVHDQDSATKLMNTVLHDLQTSKLKAAKLKAGVALEIHSRTVNSQPKLATVIERYYPSCVEWRGELEKLFAAYVEAKRAQNVVDFDDMLQYWNELLKLPGMARKIGGRFDHVLIDEYQDTNAIQASILRRMKPDGAGVTVVGDDAQAIYGFRSADVRNILDFADQFTPPARKITLVVNYRSTEPILAASNAVINLACEGFAKKLTPIRTGGSKPRLVTVADEQAQAMFVADEIQRLKKEGRKLSGMAVLFRSTYSSSPLQLELDRRRIPFKVFGGVSFTYAKQIRDVLAILKWAENPADLVSASRVLGLVLRGREATAAVKVLAAAADPMAALSAFEPPSPRPWLAASRACLSWPDFAKLMRRLVADRVGWPDELGAIIAWYRPILERKGDDHRDRLADLDQLRAMASNFKSRRKFLADLTLEPPSRSKKPGSADVDHDYLTLSTIHQCKGREWRSVFVLSVVEGCLPSSRAMSKSEIEEERRLLYVAMTRAKRDLTLVLPWRVGGGNSQANRGGDAAVARSRFIPDGILDNFDRRAWRINSGCAKSDAVAGKAIDLQGRIATRWRF